MFFHTGKPDQVEMLINALGLGNRQTSSGILLEFYKPDNTTEPPQTISTTINPTITVPPITFNTKAPIATLPRRVIPTTFTFPPVHVVQRQASLDRCPGGTGQTGLICTDAPYNTGELLITFIII